MLNLKQLALWIDILAQCKEILYWKKVIINADLTAVYGSVKNTIPK